MSHRFNVGDKVFYDDRIGIIERCDFYFNGKPCYDLVSEDDPEITCTASEEKVKPIDEVMK